MSCAREFCRGGDVVGVAARAGADARLFRVLLLWRLGLAVQQPPVAYKVFYENALDSIPTH